MLLKPILVRIPLAAALFATVQGASGQEMALEPQLRQIAPEKFESGSLTTEIDGQRHHFLTTIETLFIDPKKLSSDPKTRKAQEEMNGTIVKTAQLRYVEGNLVASLIGHEEARKAAGSRQVASQRAALEVSFTLDAKSLALKEGSRALTYKAAGDDASQQLKTDDYDLTIDSVTRLPSGALSLKGRFSGTFDATVQSKKNETLEKPVSISGTFDIVNASGDEKVIEVIHSEWP